jgi:tetratricopeptide (TPR) repeat protein
VTLALAGTIVVALAGGGALWLAGERDERERVERAAGQVRDALANARELARQSATEPPHAVAPRQRALDAADAALAATRASDPGSELRTEAETLKRELGEALAAARTAADEWQRDQATLAVLTEQISRWFVAPWDEIERAMTDALRAWGLDLATMTDEQVVARVRASTEPIEFADHLLAWIKVRHELAQLGRGADRSPEDFERLQRIVQAADPDPWRVRLRGAVPDNIELLEQAAVDPELWNQDLRTISHLGSMLTSFGKGDLAFGVLEKAARLHPEEYSFRYFLALLAKEARPRRWELALDHGSACVTMAPDAISAQMLLAVVRDALGDFNGAVGAWDAVLRLDGRSRQATAGKIWSLLYDGRYDEAAAAIATTVAAAGVASDATRHAAAVIDLATGRLESAQQSLRSLCGNAETLAAVPTLAHSLGLAGDWAGAAEAIRASQRRVNPFVSLELVIGLHATRAHALERCGDLVGARASLRQVEQVLLAAGAKQETMQRAGLERLEHLIQLSEELPDYEGGALEPANAVAAARISLLLSRAGKLETAFETLLALVPSAGNRAEILDAEPGFLVEAAGAAAQLALAASTSAETRQRALGVCVEIVRTEADQALAAQTRDPANPARSRVHVLLLDPKLRLLRDPALHTALTAEQSASLLRLGAELRVQMRLTRP